MKAMAIGIGIGVVLGAAATALLPVAAAQSQRLPATMRSGENAVVIEGNLGISLAVDRVGDQLPLDGFTDRVSRVVLTDEWALLRQPDGRDTLIAIPRERLRYLVVEE